MASTLRVTDSFCAATTAVRISAAASERLPKKGHNEYQ